MVSFDLASSQLEQRDPKQPYSKSPPVINSPQVELTLPNSSVTPVRSPRSPVPPSSGGKMASPNSAFFTSTPQSAVSMLESLNEFHEINSDSREMHAGHESLAKQTYKDRRKNYRLEKKKLAEELISAIQDPTIIVMSDWLKVRTTYKQWNKYFCELRPGSLYVYKNQKTHKSSNWIGTVMLKMCELIERPSKKNGFCFKLFHPLDHPIWSPKGPKGEAFTSLMFPLPATSIIFRAPSEETGRKWMEAIDLSLECSSLIVHKHAAANARDSVPTTPLSATSNGSASNAALAGNPALTLHSISAMNSIDRSMDDDLHDGHHQADSFNDTRPIFNDFEIEKHFDLCDDVHTDHGEHEDSQDHHTTEDSDEDSFFEDDDIALNGKGGSLRPNTARHSQNGSRGDVSSDSDIVESTYTFDGGMEEFGLVGDAGQTEDVPEENKSLLWTLLKQVRPGMDLSKVVLPTFILEPRSFLEKLADYYYHCDIISKAALEEDPLLRMKLILKWYLSGFYKKPKGLKKPYNPILGETFRCFWQHPETDSKTFYISEQVSHHPPVSAFYVTNRKDGFCISGSILAKSKFYGNSISAILEGTAKLTLLARGEDYLITFPYAHCKGIFLGPLAFELGGKIMITCAKTGYKTELEFKLKPFFGSDDQCNLVVGKLRLGNETLGTIDGHWDSEIWYKDKRKGEQELFWSGIDPKVKASRLRRFVVALEEQADHESEKLWSKVTLAIQQQNQEAATVEKTILEEAQREAAKQRTSRMEIWSPNLFGFDTNANDWLYKLAEVRPWDNRTDIKQYEHNYVVRTLTRHLTKKPLFTLPGQAAKSDKSVDGPGGGSGEPTRTKLRFRRQVTCADPTYAGSRRNDSVDSYSKVRSESTSSKAVASHQLTHSLESINSQLSNIKQSLATLEREQSSLKSEVNQLHCCLKSQAGQTVVRHSVRATDSSSSFHITRFRVRTFLSQIPTEIRQVLLVLIAHLFFHTIYSTIFPSSTVSHFSITPPVLPSNQFSGSSSTTPLEKSQPSSNS